MINEIKMRASCRYGCETDSGYIETKNGQDCVFCRKYRKHQYNAPKTETGRAARTVQTVHAAIKPNQRARILERANRHCELCGRQDELHVGHLLSVKAGLVDGLTELEINSDENLCAMCAECNLGLGKKPLPVRLMVALLMARTKHASESQPSSELPFDAA